MTGAEFGEVDIDLLADYIGGALAGTPDESAVAALIADDPAWRTTYASLRDGMTIVEAALGDLGPEPMPADVAARLEAAARLADRPAHAHRPGAGRPSRPTPRTRPRGRRRVRSGPARS